MICPNKIEMKDGSYLCFKTKSKCTDCILPPHPLVSHGTKKTTNVNLNYGDNNNLTLRQLEAMKYRNEGLTFRSIADKMNIKCSSVHKLVTKAIKKLGLTKQQKTSKRGLTKKQGGITKKANKHNVSLHNDSISFNIECDWDKIEADIKHLKYKDYKFIKNDDYVFKIYNTCKNGKQKIIIQFRKDIIRSDVKTAYNVATQRIRDFIATFSLKGIYRLYSLEQLSRHYAILGTELAKKVIKEGRQIFIYDPNDNTLRKLIDNSDRTGKGGKPEAESVHLDHAKADAEKDEIFWKDITLNDYYLPSQTKHILDTVLSVQKEYAEQIKKHLEVQDKTLLTLKAIRDEFKK